MNKLERGLIIAGIWLAAGIVVAAPSVRFERSILPETDSYYELGTSTQAWIEVSSDRFCLTADSCISAWSSAGTGFSWTPTSYGNATSTTLGFLQGFLSTASSTIHASTTITGPLTASGGVYGNLTGLASLATALNANGSNCSSGNAPLGIDASGNVESCFDVWTEAENTSAGYISGVAWGDITGTLSSQLDLDGKLYTKLGTSSALTLGDLLYSTGANTVSTVGTTTLTENSSYLSFSNPINVIGGSASVLSLDTSFLSPYNLQAFASSTYALQATTLTIAGTADQITSSAGAQDLSANRTWTLSLPNHVIFPSSFQATQASTTHATSTNQDITGLLTFNGVTSSTWTGFCETITGSAGLCDGDDATGGAGAFAWTPDSYNGQLVNATSTGLWLKASPLSLIASSTFATYASTSQLSISDGKLYFSSAGTTTIPDNLINSFTISTSTSAGYSLLSFDTINDNIGIGTAQPGGPLHILNFGDTYRGLGVTQIQTGQGGSPGVIIEQSSGNSATGLTVASNNFQMYHKVGAGNFGAGDLVFSVDTNQNININNDLFVTSDIGAGTTTPSKKLSIHGDTLISGTTSVASLIATGTPQFSLFSGCNLDTDSSGFLVCGTDATGVGSVFAWTPETWGNSTSTRLGFLNGFMSNASSTINATLSIGDITDRSPGDNLIISLRDNPNGTGGQFQLIAGNSTNGAGGAGGGIFLTAGDGDSSSGAGGGITFDSGFAGGGNANGGEMTFTAGDGAGTGNGGVMGFSAGNGGASGNGGNVTFTPGAKGASGSLNGSSIFTDTSKNTKVVINASGTVGIGIAAPKTLLHITDGGQEPATLNAATMVRVNGSQGASSSTVLTVGAGTTGVAGIGFGDEDNEFEGYVRYNNNGDKMQLYTSGNPRVTIDTNGNVGIGTTSPIGGGITITSTGPSVYLEDTDQTAGEKIWRTYGGTGSYLIRAFADDGITGGQIGLAVTRSGTNVSGVGIIDTSPTEGLLVVGNAGGGTIYGTFNTANTETLCWDGSGASLITDCTSLAIHKENVSDLQLGLAELLALTPREFDWKSDGRHDLGFIAEEVAAVNPLLASYTRRDILKTKTDAEVKQLFSGDFVGVSKSEERDLIDKLRGEKELLGDWELTGVKYDRLTSLIVKAIQEQQAQINSLQGLGGDLRITPRGNVEVISAKEVRTEKLCIGETCITEQELKDLLESKRKSNWLFDLLGW